VEKTPRRPLGPLSRDHLLDDIERARSHRVGWLRVASADAPRTPARSVSQLSGGDAATVGNRTWQSPAKESGQSQVIACNRRAIMLLLALDRALAITGINPAS